MFLYNTARKINSQIKKYKKMQNGKFLSPVRRIEFVNPPGEGKFVAMTFDDGPTTLPITSNPSSGLTDALLAALEQYGARGTFDVIGTTGGNYPDSPGKLGSFTWSGVHYDHYPKYEDDLSAGAVNRPELIEKILKGHHEITSHTYSHRLFGPMRTVYGERIHFNTLDEVVGDLERLDSYMLNNFNYKMKLSRPPHYIDKIPDGSSSYDAYRITGYNYMAASFDGAGWQPLDSYADELSAMLEPLKRTLGENPDALNGQIIFQKDGCNMNLRTPVADALGEQLKLLSDYGYKVITVSELLEKSPFEDVKNDCEEIKYISGLLKKNHTIGYRNNTFAPDRFITADEFMIMCTDPVLFRERRAFSSGDMTAIARAFSEKHNIVPKNASGNALLDIAMAVGADIDEAKLKDKKRVKRKDAVELIFGLTEKL